MHKETAKRTCTIILFFSINFGLWELIVDCGMPKEWASFDVYAILFVLMILIWRRHLCLEWKRLISSTQNWLKFAGSVFSILIAAYCAGLFMLFLITGEFNTQNTENASAMADAVPAILSCIMMSCFAPIIEECTFRESIIGGIASEKTILFMSVVSIVAFDAIHLYQWQEFFYYLPISCGLTLFYLKKDRNVWASVIMHACANLPGAIMMAFH